MSTAATATSLLANSDGYVPPGLEDFLFKPVFTVSIAGIDFGFDKVILMMLFATLVAGTFYLAAFRKPQLVPGKLQMTGEIAYDFVRNTIARDVIGPEGVKFAPYLATLFVFVFLNNLYEILPVAQMPVNSHIAFPAMLTGITYVLFIYLGVKRNGLGYFKNVAFPPGVPKAVYVLLTPIELISTFIVRPFTLAVRLFANMFAGHILLLVFFTGTVYLLERDNFSIIFFPFAGLMAIVLTAFELLVIALQAYIFTLLSAQYFAESLSDHH